MGSKSKMKLSKAPVFFIILSIICIVISFQTVPASTMILESGGFEIFNGSITLNADAVETVEFFLEYDADYCVSWEWSTDQGQIIDFVLLDEENFQIWKVYWRSGTNYARCKEVREVSEHDGYHMIHNSDYYLLVFHNVENMGKVKVNLHAEVSWVKQVLVTSYRQRTEFIPFSLLFQVLSAISYGIESYRIKWVSSKRSKKEES